MRVCVCVCVYACVCARAYVCVCVCARARACVWAYMCAYEHVRAPKRWVCQSAGRQQVAQPYALIPGACSRRPGHGQREESEELADLACQRCSLFQSQGGCNL